MTSLLLLRRSRCRAELEEEVKRMKKKGMMAMHIIYTSMGLQAIFIVSVQALGRYGGRDGLSVLL